MIRSAKFRMGNVLSDVDCVDHLDLSRSALPRLSPREFEISRLVSRGLSNKQIVMVLDSTQNTVKTHLQRIYCKLSVRTRTELAVRFVTDQMK